MMACLAASMGVSGKSMAEIWKSMPDSLVPYLGAKQRQEMIEFKSMGLSGETEHLLHGKSRIDTVTADYMSVRLNASASLVIKRLPRHTGDSVICVVRTWKAEHSESTARLYDETWQPVAWSGNSTEESGAFKVPMPTVQSAGVEVEKAEAILRTVDFVLPHLELSPSDNNMVVTWTAPLADKEEKELLGAALTPTTLVWDGETFR